MDTPADNSNGTCTWSDYRSWPEDQRWELVEGEPYAMSPSPTRQHQTLACQLTRKLGDFFEDHDCELIPAPFDVRLSEHDVVQPDLLVVCDPEQLHDTHVDGPPTLVVEILSPSSLTHDRVRKFNLYQRSGVQEYWIVTPHPALIEIFLLETGRYHLAAGFSKRDTLTSPTFPDLSLPLSDIFTFPIPPGEEIQEICESAPPYAAATAQ